MPRPHHIFEHNDENPALTGWYYAMSQKHGRTLEQVLHTNRNKEERTRIMKDIVDYLAFIHANIPVSPEKFNLNEGRENVVEGLDKLVQMGLDETSVCVVLGCYDKLMPSILSKCNLVFNKDAHAKNWIVTSNHDIVAVDFGEGIIPQAYDLVKLVGTRGYSDEQENELLELYVDSFNRYSGRKIFLEEFKEQYMGLTLQSLGYFRFWSKDNKDLSKSILFCLEKAQRTLDIPELEKIKSIILPYC